MFDKRITLFKLLDFEVRIDASWVIIAVFITWSLAYGLFPYYYKGLPAHTYWLMGAAGALGLFMSIIFHELCHSIVARKNNLQMRGITLFIFGGVAEMSGEPPDARTEFLMAIAGPLSSVFIGGVFYFVYMMGEEAMLPVSVNGVISYLAYINWILAAFNMLPAFPLDGGRVLRAALWRWKGSLSWATRVASRIGSLFGIFLIFSGILNVLSGNLLGGIWWFLIGLFLRDASQTSYQSVMTHKALEGEKVEDLMKTAPVTAPSSISIKEFVEEYVYKYHLKMFPVIDNGKLTGCITTGEIKGTPREEWGRRTVHEIMSTCTVENTIGPDVDAAKALAAMNRTGNNRLMVVKDGSLVGVISLKDILWFLSAKMDLEGDKKR
ncbi:MAG: CBS domain-containing protein [Nitrospiraceae bacterium]|nr:MAG: CBS domain-containing protein [Nitrospiraceae bacterium]